MAGSAGGGGGGGREGMREEGGDEGSRRVLNVIRVSPCTKLHLITGDHVPVDMTPLSDPAPVYRA